MAGSHRILRRGEYRLEVAAGEGPAGVRRSKGKDLAFDIDGGWQTFHITESEEIYFWWRGEHRHPGVALARVRHALGPVDNRAERRRDPRRVRETTVQAREKGGSHIA